MYEKKVTVADERARILRELSQTSPESERYETLVARLNELQDNKFKFDWNGIVQSTIKAAGPVVLGGLIIFFEKKGGAFVSQASKFIRF